MTKAISHSYTYTLRENHVHLKDSLLSADVGKMENTFYEYTPDAYYVNDIAFKSRFFSFNVFMSPQVVTVTRQFRTYQDVFAQMGGLLGLLTAIFYIFVKYFSSLAFFGSLIDILF